MDYIVRAADIGYGNTKYTVSHAPGRDIDCRMFPSLTPQATTTGDLGAGMLAKREAYMKQQLMHIHRNTPQQRGH
jgi:hypothetical protein